jgi:hypothetical protein
VKAQQTFADNVREAKNETQQPKDAYRAPRLVNLGTAVGLVQYGTYGRVFDSNTGNGRSYS